MPTRTLRELLNRLEWDPSMHAADVSLEVVDRVAGEERVVSVRFSDLSEILPAGVLVADGTFLPYHRVVAVRSGEQTLWRKAGKDEP